MKQPLLIMASILILFSGCSEKVVVLTPTAHTIDAKTKSIPTRTFSYKKVKANTTITVTVDSAVLAWRDAVWFRAKTKRLERNNQKLMVANTALNVQIEVINRIKKSKR